MRLVDTKALQVVYDAILATPGQNMEKIVEIVAASIMHVAKNAEKQLDALAAEVAELKRRVER